MTGLEPFGARLRRAMDERGPLCVGIDPHASLLSEWGLGDNVDGLERFSRTVVEAVADRVAVLKPQSAFFERFGSRGVAVLETTVREAREAGALVVMDAKRGDIGSTMAAYAEAFLHKDAPLFSDALTVSPYLGYGSLSPAVALARESGAGLFVLALTSNPEGGEVQHAVRADGRTVGATVLGHLALENAGRSRWAPSARWSAPPSVTSPRTTSTWAGRSWRRASGRRGRQPADLPSVFGSAVRNVVPNVSRGLLRHGPDTVALRDASERFADEIRAALTSA